MVPPALPRADLQCNSDAAGKRYLDQGHGMEHNRFTRITVMFSIIRIICPSDYSEASVRALMEAAEFASPAVFRP